jgi:hypothetical protein
MTTKLILSKLALLIIILSVIFACSKDRAVPLKEVPFDIKNVNFESITTNWLDKLAAKTQQKVINSAKDLPFIAKSGTKLWIYNTDLSFSNWNTVNYPFTIEITELLTPMDMILAQKPTVSNGEFLVTGGEILVKVFKDGKELILYPFSSTLPKIQVPTKKVDSKMELFYGQVTPINTVNWVAATAQKDTSRRQIQYPLIINGGNGADSVSAYTLFPRNIGWINCDRFYSYQGAKTTVKFTSEYPALEKIYIFMYLPDLKSVIQVYGGESLKIPVGQNVKIITVSQTQDGELYSFLQDLKVVDNQTVVIKLTKTTEQEFIDYLKNLVL